MKSLIDELPVRYTWERGKQFSKTRKLSYENLWRMIRKLHIDLECNRHELLNSLAEKEVQRMKKQINRYINQEMIKYTNPGIFMTYPVTITELVDMNYPICFQVSIELFVGEIEDKK